MEVTGSVDTEKQIDEKDKANNECKLTLTTKRVVRQQKPASPGQFKEYTPITPRRYTTSSGTSGTFRHAVGLVVRQQRALRKERAMRRYAWRVSFRL